MDLGHIHKYVTVRIPDLVRVRIATQQGITRSWLPGHSCTLGKNERQLLN